jgi:hypothetical protein
LKGVKDVKDVKDVLVNDGSHQPNCRGHIHIDRGLRQLKGASSSDRKGRG